MKFMLIFFLVFSGIRAVESHNSFVNSAMRGNSNWMVQAEAQLRPAMFRLERNYYLASVRFKSSEPYRQVVKPIIRGTTNLIRPKKHFEVADILG